MKLKERSIIINGNEYYAERPRQNGDSTLSFQGIQYIREEELMVAKMLDWMGIPFLHHVQFEFSFEGNSQRKILWLPDFIFGHYCRWKGEPEHGALILGLEVKHTHVNGQPRHKANALFYELHIPILIVRGDALTYYYTKGEPLPLEVLQ